ncbi:hypothetical protein GOB46_08665 [Sinorhizobium meliloti]|uniref:hypothetical protein n=2 Tax=Rhizobium meliloti TaxID=382 RepID=UPI000FD5EE74|nr:hypothetical protein [Sinorhizobium meliloti]MDW9415093.1 hypothetical protein [Sinorhizobium meliloti]MDW9479966.1 hypothetical protein [Sinorhizobium meliloti]MDW9510047.1 hypothetical protein [Sinorhizobium meliloti]MDW9634625.1 hypothetical protein [Sinorhizobium meliloti]MDW9810650.1 hypothetical protein [Sinorhizobium meliloti]
MTDATTNSPFSGESDSARPSLSLDDASSLDFSESGGTNEEEERDRQWTSETGETNEDGQETDEPADQGDETNGSEKEGEESNETPDTIITLKGGEQIPLEELKLGYMRERDYRHKTQELGNKGRNLKSMTTRVADTANAIAQFLVEQLPEEPTQALAIQNPAEYVRKKAIYDAALTHVHQLAGMGQEPRKVADELSRAANEEALAAENSKLLEAFPHLAKDEARQKFFADAFAAGEDFGFSAEEMRTVTDHRYFKVMHYAMLGLQAEHAKNRALMKVANAPPATARARPNGPVNPQARKNREAMKRLSKTGSIKDAMAIDFE